MKPSNCIYKMYLDRGIPNRDFEEHIEHRVTAIIEYLDEQYEKTTKKSKKPLKIKPSK